MSYLYVATVLGEDFTEPSPLHLTFSSGDVVGRTFCTTIGIINDNNLEFDHEFNVTLGDITATGTVAPSVTINPSTTVFISDDEGLCCLDSGVLYRVDACSVIFQGLFGNVNPSPPLQQREKKSYSKRILSPHVHIWKQCEGILAVSTLMIKSVHSGMKFPSHCSYEC